MHTAETLQPFIQCMHAHSRELQLEAHMLRILFLHNSCRLEDTILQWHVEGFQLDRQSLSNDNPILLVQTQPIHWPFISMAHCVQFLYHPNICFRPSTISTRVTYLHHGYHLRLCYLGIRRSIIFLFWYLVYLHDWFEIQFFEVLSF